MSRKRSPASVGAKLRKARERRGLSLRQIADSTKISVPVLEGLERNDITHLPGGVLGRGYVRSFAAAVKLDPEITVAEFVAQFPESSVKDGYPPAARFDEDAGGEVGPSRSSTKIRLYDSGRFTRVASAGVIAVLLAGVIAFAAPERWPAWTALQDWGTSAVGSTITSARLKTLDARPLQLIRPAVPPTLPSARALPRVRKRAGPVRVAASSKRASTPAAASTVEQKSPSENDESVSEEKSSETLTAPEGPETK
jgi:cytoskeletal protein RodZ